MALNSRDNKELGTWKDGRKKGGNNVTRIYFEDIFYLKYSMYF